MEDTYPHSHPQTFPSKFSPKNPNPKKPHSHFMYKAIIFAILVLILPLFSYQSSEATDRAENWELIQLIFVGIMVSYVIFSRKNNEAEENHQKLEKLNSYLSNFLQVSSFFDDKAEEQSMSSMNYAVGMWKSQYLKRDPLVILEKENSNFENRERPLLLPVRSLKSELSKSDFSEKINDRRSGNFRKSISNSGSKPLSMDVTKTRNWEFEEICSMEFDSKIQENCFSQSSNQSDSKLEELKSEMKNETDGAPLFPLASTLSSESKGNDSIGNMSERSLKEKKLWRSVRTIRKFKSASDDFTNRGAVEEKETNLTSEKIFDYRDYEKGKAEELRFGKSKSEEFDCNSERDVDKKADEFIAKFREQIRLQRTESFRR